MTVLHVTIRRNADGVVRVYDFTYDGMEPWDDESSEFIWSEGNYACDCNRARFFDRAAGGDGNGAHDPCGDERFTILSITQDDDHKVLYAEDEP